jgi:DNA-directed RNA polymerase specialized sigma subunit
MSEHVHQFERDGEGWFCRCGVVTQSSLYVAKEAYEAKKRAADVLTQAVRKARKTHSLAEIAQELGVSRQRVHQIERQS